MNAPIMLFIPSIINPVALSVIIALWAPSPLSVGDAEYDSRPGSLKRRPSQGVAPQPAECGPERLSARQSWATQASRVQSERRQLTTTWPECTPCRLSTEHRLPGGLELLRRPPAMYAAGPSQVPASRSRASGAEPVSGLDYRTVRSLDQDPV